MYVYFNKKGIIVEIINNEQIRQGSDNANKIYLHFEDALSLSICSLILKKPSGALSNEYFLTKTIGQVPYNRLQDTKYFKYFVDYSFYELALSNEDLNENGLFLATARLFYESVIKAQGTLTFNVFNSVINVDNVISQSQYDYLLKYVASFQEQIDGSKQQIIDIISHLQVIDDSLALIDSRLDLTDAQINTINNRLFSIDSSLVGLRGDVVAVENDVDYLKTNIPLTYATKIEVNGAVLNVELDPDTYVVTFSRLNAPDIFIDLPIEQLIKGLSYDESTKEIVLTLENGTEMRVPIGDLVEDMATMTWTNANFYTKAQSDSFLNEKANILDLYDGNIVVKYAERAVSDNAGHVISDYYATKTEVSRKADNIYAKSSITNGNMQSTSGWSTYKGTQSAMGRKLLITCNDVTTSGNVSTSTTLNTNLVANHVYYYRATYNTPALEGNPRNNNLYLGAQVWTFGQLTPNSILTVSVVVTKNASISNQSFATYPFGDNSNKIPAILGQTAELSNVTLIDLTATFGAGNEPSRETMDKIVDRKGGFIGANDTEIINLLDVFNGNNDSGWLTPTLINGATGTIRYRKIGKIVNVIGDVNLIASGVFATLPVGFRPISNLTYLGANNLGEPNYNILIQLNGTLAPIGNSHIPGAYVLNITYFVD